MKKAIFGLFMGILLIAPFGQTAKAYSPYVSANWEGNNIRVNIGNAQPNTRVDVYYRTQDSQVWSVMTGLGNTDWNGSYAGTVNLGLSSGSSASLYAMVGSDMTSTVNLGGSGCYGSNCYNNLTFSPQNPSLSVGQSLGISIYGGGYYSGNYYISSNSNSSAVSASISGSTLNLYGQSSGSASITVCQSGSYYGSGSGNCGTLYVSVSGSLVGGMTFSPQNPSLSVGQSLTVSVFTPYLYSGNYYISSNSNSSAVSASISGNSIYLYANNPGNATLSVCLSGGSGACGSLYVTVSGASYNNLTFSPQNPSLSVGQSLGISIYGGGYYSGNYYISSNSNSSAVSASISGSTLNLYGQSSGSASITVCQSGSYYGSGSGNCGTLYVSVSGYGQGNFYLNPSSLALSVGQTSSVTANLSSPYSGNFYLASNSNPGVASVTFSGSTANVYGIAGGSTTLNLCYGWQCANLYVTVSGSGGCYGSNCYGSLYFTTTSLPQPTVGQYYSYQLQASGGSGSYSYYLNSGSLPSGLSLSVSGQIYGTPSNTSPANFSIRVSDSYNRTGNASLALTPVSGSVLGTSLYANGTLIRDNGTVYIVYKNTKSGFANAAAFRGLGFSFSKVAYVSTAGLADSGYIVATANAAHPWGSWIKTGNTVYFAHESGLIPVSSGEIFLNNGGVWGLVVSANTHDFARPILPVMEYNDSRLR